MPLNITQINDAESARQKRNLTQMQKKNADLTKEGVVINTFVKGTNMDDIYSSLLISQDTKLPEKLQDNKTTQDKSLLPLSIIATGVMAIITGLSFLAKRSIKANKDLPSEKKLQDMIRNVNIDKEEVQGIYQIVHCPNKKTILAGIGVVTLSAMAFMGKMFIDGFKEVWVKKREADIQKNLQENLIAVETQSFSGKMQIIRSMLSDKAKEFGAYICPECKPGELNFKGNSAKSEQEQPQQNKKNNVKYFALGGLTLAAIAGLGFVSIRTLTKAKKDLGKYTEMRRNEVMDIVKNSDMATKINDKIQLQKILQSIDADSDFVKETLSKLKWKDDAERDEFIKSVNLSIQKSTTEPPMAVGGSGTPKPSFNSYINSYKAFCYNYLLDSENPQFRMLFLGVTGLSALTYGGKVLGEGVKEVQVKKMNAQTELDLQKRLVSTELRNFKAKKDSAIDPLCEEFYTQVQNGKPKEQLKTLAENILFEVKNGPPFVYS